MNPPSLKLGSQTADTEGFAIDTNPAETGAEPTAVVISPQRLMSMLRYSHTLAAGA
ncbi:hypothetical protein [Schlesneria sp. DSM 10557]|uniref:hypothetical protein n=1 Tax=Schlesneria sp. DSM 10557 TaxID=3044399 RepID=UPI0035A0E3EC